MPRQEAEQKCEKVPRQSCTNVPREVCEQKPKQVRRERDVVGRCVIVCCRCVTR